MHNNPGSLYKYLGFSNRMFMQIINNDVYYSDPTVFNDPLDCKPKVICDLALDESIELLSSILNKRISSEYERYLKILKFQGLKSEERIHGLTKEQVSSILAEYVFSASDPNFEDKEIGLKNILCDAYSNELLRMNGKGVLCLSSKFNSPLMWSHYAEQHKGVCIEYDVRQLSKSLEKVSYGDTRVIKTSTIKNWFINNDEEAYRSIINSSFLTKANEWRYETEWRIFGKVGIHRSPAILKSIIFGLRCTDEIKYGVIKSLNNAENGIKFWEIFNNDETFELKRRLVNTDELLASYSCSHYSLSDLDSIDDD